MQEYEDTPHYAVFQRSIIHCAIPDSERDCDPMCRGVLHWRMRSINIGGADRAQYVNKNQA